MAGFTLDQLNAGRGGGTQRNGFTLDQLNAAHSQFRKAYDERLRNYRDAEPVYRNGKPAYKSRNEAFKAIAQQLLDTGSQAAYNDFRNAALGALKDDARNAVLRKRYDRLVTQKYDGFGDDETKAAYLKSAMDRRSKYKVNEFDELLSRYDPSIKVEDKGAQFAFDRGFDPRTIVTSSPTANGLGVKRNPLENNPYLTGPEPEPEKPNNRLRKAKMSMGDGVSMDQIEAIASGKREGIVTDLMGLATGKSGSRYVELDGTERAITEQDRQARRDQNRELNYDPDRGYTGG